MPRLFVIGMHLLLCRYCRAWLRRVGGCCRGNTHSIATVSCTQVGMLCCCLFMLSYWCSNIACVVYNLVTWFLLVKDHHNVMVYMAAFLFSIVIYIAKCGLRSVVALPILGSVVALPILGSVVALPILRSVVALPILGSVVALPILGSVVALPILRSVVAPPILWSVVALCLYCPVW